MGAQEAKPNPPETNEAKGNADVALKGLDDEANEWMLKCRMGVASGDTLGYSLTDQKLQNFEKKMIVQTTVNAPKEEINQAVEALFSEDWKELTKLCLNQLASFFSGSAPAPSEAAVYEFFSKGYLRYEFSNLVQYSVMVRKTNCTSTGTLVENTGSTIMACVCSGLVNYALVDPQATIYNIQKSQPDISPDDLITLLENIEKSMIMAARLAKAKKAIEQGTDINPVTSLTSVGFSHMDLKIARDASSNATKTIVTEETDVTMFKRDSGEPNTEETLKQRIKDIMRIRKEFFVFSVQRGALKHFSSNVDKMIAGVSDLDDCKGVE